MEINPVLPGSHPDPSILRVDADYYLATSTFEWYPGVRLHHSRDLVRWRPLGGILDGTRLLDLTGCPDSGGVWAPNLTWVDGVFHLVYSNVSSYAGGFTDSPNYLTTAPSIDGPWSDPVLLHARGFDASLFHDGPDSWLLNLVHDWRPGHGGSAGLEATRFDRANRRLVGEPVRIALPPDGGWIEGPNLYRRNGWYHLVTADGGTGYQHQVSVCRSRELAGPYERHPGGPLLTAKHRPDWPLQKAGHGSLVQTPEGDWYLAYLVARPSRAHGPCVLGRETAIAPVRWGDDDWPTVPGGLPPLELPAPADDAPATAEEPLGPQWSTLRRPATADWVTGDGKLVIRGGRSPRSHTGVSLVARRLTATTASLHTTMGYRPQAFQHLAGVTAYYNTRNWHFLYATLDEHPVLRVATSDRGVLTVHPDTAALPSDEVRLRVDVDGDDLTFRYDTGDGWHRLGPVLDATVLSDEHAEEFDGDQIRALGFTGAFLGLWVWDLNGHGHPAQFTQTAYSTR